MAKLIIELNDDNITVCLGTMMGLRMLLEIKIYEKDLVNQCLFIIFVMFIIFKHKLYDEHKRE